MTNIKNFPVEIILNICENIYILDDIICLYKTCNFFKQIIEKYKIQILSKLFMSETFSNSYYNLFFSFVNNKYELLKPVPYLNLKQLLGWNLEYIKYNRGSNNQTNINSEILNTQMFLVKIFTEEEKLQKSFVDGSLGLFKNFMHIMFMPTKYIYNSTVLSNKYLNTKGLVSKNRGGIMIKLQKELHYLRFINKETPIYVIYPEFRNDDIVFDNLIKIYPDVIANHILNLEKFLNKKMFKKILHNFLINLFLEWLFDNECDFIENIYYKIYLAIPQMLQKIIYRIIYADFDIKHSIDSEEFVDVFYEIHRIFLPTSKIIGLYNRLRLWEYENTIKII